MHPEVVSVLRFACHDQQLQSTGYCPYLYKKVSEYVTEVVDGYKHPDPDDEGLVGPVEPNQFNARIYRFVGEVIPPHPRNAYRIQKLFDAVRHSIVEILDHRHNPYTQANDPW